MIKMYNKLYYFLTKLPLLTSAIPGLVVRINLKLRKGHFNKYSLDFQMC